MGMILGCLGALLCGILIGYGLGGPHDDEQSENESDDDYNNRIMQEW